VIKAVLFDLDGVVFSNGSKIAIRRLRKDKRIPRGIAQKIIRSDYAWEYRLGKHSAKQHWGWAAKELKNKSLAKEIRKIFLDAYYLKKGMAELVTGIKAHYKTAAISNTVGERISMFEKRYGFRSLFDAEVYSHLMGVGKPDPAMYLEAANRLNVQLRECIFIDNKEKNVRAAEKLGAMGIVFKSIPQLKKGLTKAGVKI